MKKVILTTILMCTTLHAFAQSPGIGGVPNPLPALDPNNASFTSWPTVSPGAVAVGTRALGYTCSAATVVVLTDGSGNTLTTTLPAGSFHSFMVEVPTSFSVTGTNSCVFTAEK